MMTKRGNKLGKRKISRKAPSQNGDKTKEKKSRSTTVKAKGKR